jgi:DNA mismatch repair protein MutS
MKTISLVDSKRRTHDELKAAETAPAMRLFRQFKQRFQDCIVLFRMDDFYALYEDAEICSKVLGLEITTRDVGSGNSVPMVEILWQIIESNLKKMQQAGYKVAVIEQVGKRGVARIITPSKTSDK